MTSSDPSTPHLGEAVISDGGIIEWDEIARDVSPDGRRAIAFFQDADARVKYQLLSWQKYHVPTFEDRTAPIEGGYWVGDDSAIFFSFVEARASARREAYWVVPKM